MTSEKNTIDPVDALATITRCLQHFSDVLRELTESLETVRSALEDYAVLKRELNLLEDEE